jgi:hypothetical protein
MPSAYRSESTQIGLGRKQRRNHLWLARWSSLYRDNIAIAGKLDNADERIDANASFGSWL